jgi:endonuclease/exonuclease/phosphatase family metal-dependent hydrolase
MNGSGRAMVALVLAGALAGCRSDDRVLGGAAAPPKLEAVSTGAEGPAPIIDGWFDDWPESSLVMEDPPGDATGAFDVTRLHATSRGAALYLRFDTTQLLNLYNGSSDDGTLEIALELADGRVLRVDLRGRDASLDGLVDVSWKALGFVAAPNHAGREFELRMDLDLLDVAAGDRLRLWLDGSDRTEPITIELGETSTDSPPEPAADRVPGAIRVASLNTREAGLADPKRADAIGRLLGAAAADVYLLQELGSLDDAEIADRMRSVSPLGSGSPRWNVHGVSFGDYVKSAVVSRRPLVPIPTPPARFAGAIVELDGGPIAAFSVHLKCCGYLDSPEDVKRLAEGEMLRSTIEKLRAGEIGEALAPHASVPVVVMGDFNDVGSPELQRLLTEGGLGLERVRLRHLRGAHVSTWRSASESFPPSVLDLAFYGDAALAGGYILDAERLDPTELEALGLEASDSGASDHLMLVADFVVAAD